MSFRIKLLELVLAVLFVVNSETKESETKKCPSYCTCDLFENLNRADCSGQRLISPNVEVPTAAEILDLSYNDITTLDNDCFEGLIYVINVSIAYNALHTIYLDAFSPMKAVKSIDLSFNRLEYFDERIFETNTKLTRLNLSGNKFMSLQNKPLIRSATIRYLGLHDAQVTYIYPLMFSEMPALRELDASNNLMISLTTTAFNSLQNLETINLEENRWICDESLNVTLHYLKNHGVDTQLSSCVNQFESKRVHGAPRMFERMMEAPPSELASATELERDSVSVKDIWNTKEPIDFEIKEKDSTSSCEQQKIENICELHRSCVAGLKSLVKEKPLGEDIPCRGQFSENDIHFVFLTGISLGIAATTCLLTCALCIKCTCGKRKRIPQRPCERPRGINNNNLAGQRRPVRSPPLNRSLSSPVRRGPPDGGNHMDFATFISRFFERPSRHQYYRTINENTGYMIRRLSQSNLFNNRLSQHLSGTRNSNGENVQQVEPLIGLQTSEVNNQPQVHRSSGDRWQRMQANMILPPPPPRPETPPPSYGEVVKPNDVV